MPSSSSAARKSPSVARKPSTTAKKNKSVPTVDIQRNDIISRGKFRVTSSGTYEGGYRDGNEAVCKRFKTRCEPIEKEYFKCDFGVANKVISIAEDWNKICPEGAAITVTKCEIIKNWDGIRYLVEPFIRRFTKFTSNNGWIAEDEDEEEWACLAMEAFSHYSYHRSRGTLIVCDLQGRHREDRYKKERGRIELTDPAICSRKCKYGPTDLGEKGIESFFANHVCNKFCHRGGKHWASPKYTQKWFDVSPSTSMVASKYRKMLSPNDGAIFSREMEPIYEESDEDYYDDLSDEKSVVSVVSTAVSNIIGYFTDVESDGESDEESDEESVEESDEDSDTDSDTESESRENVESDGNIESEEFKASSKDSGGESSDEDIEETDEGSDDDNSSYDSR